MNTTKNTEEEKMTMEMESADHDCFEFHTKPLPTLVERDTTSQSSLSQQINQAEREECKIQESSWDMEENSASSLKSGNEQHRCKGVEVADSSTNNFQESCDNKAPLWRMHSSEHAASTKSTTLPTLLEEAEECIAQSNLIFLLADLRLLSATGRIHTSYDTIAIDSDFISRADSGRLAHKMLEDEADGKEFIPQCHGMFPAQIMAVLLIELRREVNALKTRQGGQKGRHDSRYGVESERPQDQASLQQPNVFPNSMVDRSTRLEHRQQTESTAQDMTTEEYDNEDSSSSCSCSTSSDDNDNPRRRSNRKQRATQEETSLLSTWTNRKGRKQYEVDMTTRLRAYSDMIGQDLTLDRPEITRYQLMERMKSYYFKKYYHSTTEPQQERNEEMTSENESPTSNYPNPLSNLKDSIMSHYTLRYRSNGGANQGSTSSPQPTSGHDFQGKRNVGEVRHDKIPSPEVSPKSSPPTSPLRRKRSSAPQKAWTSFRKPNSGGRSLSNPDHTFEPINQSRSFDEVGANCSISHYTVTLENDSKPNLTRHTSLDGLDSALLKCNDPAQDHTVAPLDNNEKQGEHKEETLKDQNVTIRLCAPSARQFTCNNEKDRGEGNNNEEIVLMSAENVYEMSSTAKDCLLDNLNAAAQANEQKRHEQRTCGMAASDEEACRIIHNNKSADGNRSANKTSTRGSRARAVGFVKSLSSMDIKDGSHCKDLSSSTPTGNHSSFEDSVKADAGFSLEPTKFLTKPKSLRKQGRSLTWAGGSRSPRALDSSVIASEGSSIRQDDLAISDPIAHGLYGDRQKSSSDESVTQTRHCEQVVHPTFDHDDVVNRQQTQRQSIIPPKVGEFIQHVRDTNREKIQVQKEKIQSTKERVAVKAAAVKEKVNQNMDKLQHMDVKATAATAAANAAAAMSEEAATRQRLETLVNDFFQVGAKATKEGGELASSNTRPLTEDELLDLMERAVGSRRRERVQFMASFFREGTVSHLMAKSNSQVVWLNDWYPLKDPTYSISIDSEKKRVLLVFRGAITRADWGHSKDFNVKRTLNPILAPYKGRKKHLKFHRGFYLYMFRRRKDTGTNKYDEIAAKVAQYAKVLGEDHKIVVTGYSLGAALGTLFVFYASLDERFTKNGPVKFISFGCPYVGGYAFGDAFRYQEQQRKIVYARFHNERDIVTHGPNLNMGWSSRGAIHVHVGVGVKLPRKKPLLEDCCFCCHPGPQIRYLHDEGTWFQSWSRAVRNNFFFNAPLPWRIRTVHTLNEHQDRILHGRASAHWNPYLDLSLEELYENIVLPQGIHSSSSSKLSLSADVAPKENTLGDNDAVVDNEKQSNGPSPSRSLV